MEEYIVYLQEKLEISSENEIKNMKHFFESDDFKPGKYILSLIVVGDEKENWHQIIPIGKMTMIGLVYGNRIRYTKDIEGVFDFELSDGDYNNQREFIKEWFYKIKTNQLFI
jgi:hypothetical protein